MNFRKTIFFRVLGILLTAATFQSVSAQNFLPNLNLDKSIQNDTGSYYFKEIWIKSKDINTNDPEGYYERASEKIRMGYISAGISDLENLVKLDSTFSTGYTMLGYCWLMEDSVDQAKVNFQKALTLDDSTAANYYYLGYVYMMTGQKTTADSLFSVCIEHDPDTYLAYFGKANLAFISGNFQKAEKLYRKVNRLAPDFVTAYFNQAIVYLLTDPDRALHYLNKTLKLNPKYAMAYYFRGYLGIYLGKGMKSTLNDWGRAIEIDSTGSLYRISRGFLYLSRNRYDEGISDLEVVINSSKSKNYTSDFAKSADIQRTDDFFTQLVTVNEYLHNFSTDEKKELNEALGQFFNQKYDDALNIYNSLLKTSSKGLIYYLEGFDQEYMHDFKTAYDYYIKALQQKDFPYEAYLRKGKIELDLKLYNEAIRDMSIYINKYDNIQFAYRCRGISYEYLNMFDSAICDFNHFLKLDSTVSDIYFNRGFCYKALGEYRPAVDNFEKVLSDQGYDMETILLTADCKLKLYDTSGASELLDSSKVKFVYISANQHLTRGKLYLSLKRYVDAIDDFNTYLLFFKDDGEVYMYRGKAHYDNREYQLALDDFNTAISKNQDDINAIYMRGMDYVKLGRRDLAYKDFITAEKLGHPFAREAIKAFFGDQGLPDANK